jgi:hypothetical protein
MPHQTSEVIKLRLFFYQHLKVLYYFLEQFSTYFYYFLISRWPLNKYDLTNYLPGFGITTKLS